MATPTDDPLSPHAEPAQDQEDPAPTANGRGRRLAARAAARLASGARPHLGSPDVADGLRGRAPAEAVRLAPPRPRGRAVQAPAAEDRRVPGLPLRSPPLPGLRQGRPTPE